MERKKWLWVQVVPKFQMSKVRSNDLQEVGLIHISATLELGANQVDLLASQLSQTHVADNPSPCFTYPFAIPHFCRGQFLRFVSSPVSAMMFLRLGPLVCESLKSEVCRNASDLSTQILCALCQPFVYANQCFCRNDLCVWWVELRGFHLRAEQF